MTLSKIKTGSVENNINIGSNTLVVDGTNTLVGIGRDTPLRTFEVYGAGAEMSLVDTNQSTDRKTMNWYMSSDKAHWRILNDAQSAGGTAISIDNDGVITTTRGIIQTITSTPNTHASGNPVNTWAEINSNYRVAITPKYSNSRILGTYHIPMNPTGAANILFVIAPWYSTDGGTTKTIIAQGGALGVRFNLCVAWTRSANGFDANDMQNHVVHFHHDPGTTGTVTYGYYFRSEGGNNTFFNHSSGNSSSWGWTAPHYMELRELRV